MGNTQSILAFFILSLETKHCPNLLAPLCGAALNVISEGGFIQYACDLQEGQVWIANGLQKPEGMCDSAWKSMSAFVMTLSHGGGDFCDGWMKNPKSAMISCNDGFRPVSFDIEALDEDADETQNVAESQSSQRRKNCAAINKEKAFHRG